MTVLSYVRLYTKVFLSVVFVGKTTSVVFDNVIGLLLKYIQVPGGP